MRIPPHLPHLLAAASAALLFAAGPARAGISTHTSQASYLGAVGATGVDTFDDLVVDAIATPLARSAGAFSYTASVTSGTAYGASDDDVDMWLTTASPDATITFGGFGTGVAGAGGFFFGTDLFGFSQPIDHITLSATDSTGATVTETIANPGTASFVGFVSTASLVSLTVSIGGTADGWPTVNDLHLSAPVPEPAAYALLLAGLGLLGYVARRKPYSTDK